MKNIFYMIIITVIVIFACLNATTITEGCRQGISLWYNSIIPVLLPFMLLTGVILSTIDLNSISARSACLLTLIIGLFCGFPTGTLTISFLYQNNRINRHTAQSMLPLCNNVSPMFLYGYIYSSYLCRFISLKILLTCLYIPQFIFTALILFMPHKRYALTSHSRRLAIKRCAKHSRRLTIKHRAKHEAAATVGNSPDQHPASLFDTAAHNITFIGIYMVIFAIFSSIITHYLPYRTAYIATAFLEISSGIDTLNSITITDKIKTVLSLSLTAFGGLSALFQSYDLIQKTGLSFIKYIYAKCLYGVLCAMTTFFML